MRLRADHFPVHLPGITWVALPRKIYATSVSVSKGGVHFNFRPCNPKQSYLLPPSLDDWFPENHLARFISDAVDFLKNF